MAETRKGCVESGTKRKKTRKRKRWKTEATKKLMIALQFKRHCNQGTKAWVEKVSL